MRRWNGGWVGPKFLPKVKHDCLHGWRRGRRQTWAKHKDKGSFECHHLPPLCLLWMVQVSKVDMAKCTKCKLKTSIECFCTLSLLAWCWLSMEALACSTNHSGVIKFYAIHVETMEVCGGMKAHFKTCWSTMIAKINLLTIKSFCGGG